MMAQNSRQRLARNQWDVSAENQQVSGKISPRFLGALDRVACAQLLILKDPRDTVLAASLLDLVRTVSDHNRHPHGIQTSGRAQNVRKQRLAAHVMKDFREVRPHPFSEPGGQNDDAQ
jgi:hypothetical protein